MKIAIVNLSDGGLSGGYQKYLRNVVPLLARDCRVRELAVFIPSGCINLLVDSTVSVRFIPPWNTLRKIVWLKNKIATWMPDVVFVPTARRLSCGNIPVVTMVRNMEPLVTPFTGNPLKEKVINIGRMLSAWHACRRATRVIAVSKYVRYYLINKWGIPKERIGVVYHGIDSGNLPLLDAGDGALATQSAPFLFTAGSIRPARGLEDIIRAMAILDATNTLRLVIAGESDPGMATYLKKLKKISKELGVSERIYWVGYLNADEMAWSYANCRAFVMSSRAEACPNIALEAMKYGCIIISSQNPPLTEFFGEAAFYYPPRDPISLAGVIRKALSIEQRERATLSSAGKKIISRFLWSSCAYETITELEKATKSCGS